MYLLSIYKKAIKVIYIQRSGEPDVKIEFQSQKDLDDFLSTYQVCLADSEDPQHTLIRHVDELMDNKTYYFGPVSSHLSEQVIKEIHEIHQKINKSSTPEIVSISNVKTSQFELFKQKTGLKIRTIDLNLGISNDFSQQIPAFHWEL